MGLGRGHDRRRYLVGLCSHNKHRPLAGFLCCNGPIYFCTLYSRMSPSGLEGVVVRRLCADHI